MNGTSTEEISISASDGFGLEGTLFRGAGSGPLVLICGATAVPRGYYRNFAETLVAEHGFKAVLTFDYRGTGGYRNTSLSDRAIRMRDWALLDIPSAFDYLKAIAPEHEIVGIGQSYGSQTLGLSGRADQYSRFVMLAPMTGYWRNFNGGWKEWLRIRVVGMPVASLIGHLPESFGLGSRLPGGVFLEWGRWCLKPEYFFDDKTLNAPAMSAAVKTPIFAISAEDDNWGTPASENALLKYYPNANIKRWRIDPREAGHPVGHLGFFRSRFKDTLWPVAIAWLKQGDYVAA
ncbi:hypothetical protein [Rhizobium sp. L1K21]|uniref:alpha/beta hydrolase family protein n=1 Tax=Rhizobium sp. L1K21 TaxID=2954933 RepID=UPI0020932158|nr:hypothetical protein [Rhizobium sp. L1K21]MCO6186326.1 hypothetical protein [Rhizobium sp. L1K21]